MSCSWACSSISTNGAHAVCASPSGENNSSKFDCHHSTQYQLWFDLIMWLRTHVPADLEQLLDFVEVEWFGLQLALCHHKLG